LKRNNAGMPIGAKGRAVSELVRLRARSSTDIERTQDLLPENDAAVEIRPLDVKDLSEKLVTVPSNSDHLAILQKGPERRLRNTTLTNSFEGWRTGI